MLGLMYRYGIYLPDLAPFPIINDDLLGAKTRPPFWYHASVCTYGPISQGL